MARPLASRARKGWLRVGVQRPGEVEKRAPGRDRGAARESRCTERRARQDPSRLGRNLARAALDHLRFQEIARGPARRHAQLRCRRAVQSAVSCEHEPRAANSHDRDPRLRRSADRGGRPLSRAQQSDRAAAYDQAERHPPDAGAERHPRPVPARVRGDRRAAHDDVSVRDPRGDRIRHAELRRGQGPSLRDRVPRSAPPRDPDGPRPAAADPDSHHRQRDQVHRTGIGRTHGRAGAPGEARARTSNPGDGQRCRRSARQPRWNLQRVLAGRHIDEPKVRRHRPRTDDLASACPPSRWRHRGGEHGGEGQLLRDSRGHGLARRDRDDRGSRRARTYLRRAPRGRRLHTGVSRQDPGERPRREDPARGGRRGQSAPHLLHAEEVRLRRQPRGERRGRSGSRSRRTRSGRGLRPDPDGHANAGHGRLRGQPTPPRERLRATHHRAHGPRASRRPAALPRRRLHRLRNKTDRPSPPRHPSPPLPLLPLLQAQTELP